MKGIYAMTLKKKVIPAARIAEVRDYIENRFGDIGECDFGVSRGIAHDALDRLIEGDFLGASLGIDKLGPENARILRTKFSRLDFSFE